MGATDARPARISDWGSRSIGTIWRAFDLQIATYAVVLACFGLAMAYSNSVASGEGALVTGSVFLRGLLWTSLALVAFILATAFDYRWLRTLVWPLYILQIGLLATTLAIGSGVGGSSRWISVLGLQFQFSELAKILMIVILANYLSSRRGKMDSFWSILGACVLAGPPWALVLLQPDLGTSLVFGAILVGMLFLSGASLRWLGAMALAVLSALPFVWTYVLRDYQKERLTSFIDPLSDIRGAGYQLYQSQIAVGSGGWFGKGLTNSTQNQLDFLPVQTTDFVFAPGRGAWIHRRHGGHRTVHRLDLAGPGGWLAIEGSVRNHVRRGPRFDARFPAVRQRRDGHRDHADHGHPAPVHNARRGVADQHRGGPRDPPEHQYQTGSCRVVTGT